jgi:hypothetical protein
MGNVLSHDLSVASPDGTTDSVHVVLTRDSADLFRDDIAILADGVWTPVAKVR